jgi:hypothetical protein
MKKLFFCLATVLFLSTISPNQGMAKSKPTTATVLSPEESAKVDALLVRLNEIKSMDKSDLNRAEKRELRDEVRATKEALHAHGHGGFYISGGAIIIVLLLIILL